MTKGFVLPFFYKPGYAKAACNLAHSIKKYFPSAHITAFHDASINSLTENKRQVFDTLIEIPSEVLNYKGRVDPAFVKLSIYDYLPYDYNLVLDVDALALQDLEPLMDRLIDEGGPYYAHLLGKITLQQQGPNINYWLKAETMWSHFHIDEAAVMPCVNSSFQFIKKCSQAEELYHTALEDYANQIPLASLSIQWGGGQPDELYMNVALAKHGIDPSIEVNPLFMANKISNEKETEIKSKYYLLCLYGNKRQIRGRYSDWYDRMLKGIMRDAGLSHDYKWSYIKSDKHANLKPTKDMSKSRFAVEVPKELMLA
jgi:hypothetical protein